MTYWSKKLAVQQQEEEVLFAISFLKAYLLALITGAYFTDERLGYRWSLLDKRIAIAKSFVFSNARQEAFAFRFALNSAQLSQWGGKLFETACLRNRQRRESCRERERERESLDSSFLLPSFCRKKCQADWNRRMILALPNFLVRPLPLNFSFSLEIRDDGYQKRHWRSRVLFEYVCFSRH